VIDPWGGERVSVDFGGNVERPHVALQNFLLSFYDFVKCG
jgi:hypothetical protein